MDRPWLYAGGAAAVGLLATGWGYLRGAMQYVSSWLIIAVTVKGYQSDAVQLHLRERFSASRFGPRQYTAWLLHVRPLRRTQLVSMEVVGKGGRLYWSGWRPLWVAKSEDLDDSQMETGVTARDYESSSLTLMFLRGTFDTDRLIQSATQTYNDSMVGVDADDGQPGVANRRRHYVRHIFGTAGKPMGRYQSGGEVKPPSTAGDTRALSASSSDRLEL